MERIKQYFQQLKTHKMSTEIAKIDPKQFGLEESKAQEMTSGLSVTLDERKA